MTINLVLPHVGSQGGGAKDYIISILSDNLPLSAKDIKLRISKQFNGNLTYQAVHKSLNELEQQEVLKKEEGLYELNKAWVDKLESFARTIIEKKQASNEYMDGKTIVTNSLYETDLMIFKIVSEIIGKPKEKPILCLHWHHSWIPLFLNNEKYHGLKNIIENTDFYFLIRYKTVVDEWIRDYLVKRGAHNRIGVDVASTIDLVIIGDYIVQVFYPV